MWTGVLTCVELEVERPAETKKRRASAVGVQLEDAGRLLNFRDSFNIK
jgi:hypothetical protein